jgi:hypothetical protein
MLRSRLPSGALSVSADIALPLSEAHREKAQGEGEDWFRAKTKISLDNNNNAETIIRV